jgi:hypothetical protein
VEGYTTYKDKNDPIGSGWSGWHNEGKTDPASPPTFYWAIVKTTGLDPLSTLAFVNAIAWTVCHELVEQCVDRDGSYEEIGDPCNCQNAFTYRGWGIQKYWSEWGNRCINGDNPVSLKQFLKAIGFDFQHNGLKSLGTSTLNLDYIALTMRLKNSGSNAPSHCYDSPDLNFSQHRNQLA